MSKEFYKYLAKRTVDYFQSQSIKSGDKYILKFDNESEVESFYKALDIVLDEYTGMKTEYVTVNDDTYCTIGFSAMEPINIFVVPELEITNAYMTRLRNTVKDNWAMLIVCHSPIDSIAGGTESLQKEGMPFHRKQLVDDIKRRVQAADLTPAIKQLLLFDIKSKENVGYMDSYTISDYAEVITVLANKAIEENEFKKFSLFYDQDVYSMINDQKTISDRINDNNKYYKKINDSVRFGNPDHDLAKDFSDDFIKRVKDNSVKKEHWDDGITYADVIKSLKKKTKGEQHLLLERISVLADDINIIENKDYYVKAEAEKGVKNNRKHILIFNTYSCFEFEIEVLFSDSIKKNTIKLSDEKTGTEAVVSGKKLSIHQHHSGISINRVDLKCTEKKENFQISFCIINCAISWFKSVSTLYLIDAKPKKKRPKSLIINCNSEEIIFNDGSDLGETVALDSNVSLTYDESKFYKLRVSENSFNDENCAYATLAIGDEVLSILFKEEAPLNVSCSGVRIEQKKLHAKQSFLYHGCNKLSLGTNEYNTQGELKNNLALEEYIVKNRIMSCDYYSSESINSISLDVKDEIRNSYIALLDYCNANNTLPSLVYYGKDFIELAQKYVDAVFQELSEFEDNKPLSTAQQNILKIGVVNYPEKNVVAYYPFHPLNVAYQILLAKEALNMKNEIREDILKKLCSDNLMPMIRNEKGELCRILEQKHSPQWTYYYKADEKKNNGSRDFVSVIVKEKILEFYNHFKYLFGEIGSNKIIINAVNMGDCHNLFKGIIDFYKEQLKKQFDNGKTPESMLTIIVNIYNDDKLYNAFECLAHKPLLKKFLDDIGFREEKSEYSESELINCLVSNIRYYRKNKTDANYEYCHLSFIEMDQKTNEGFSNHTDIKSGTMLNGLVSGVSSTYYGQSHSYRTGYGSKFNISENTSGSVLALADRYNSAMYVFGQSNPYVSNNVICTFIDDKETEMIEKTYDSSNWVVFIDPKVDLNFFKNVDKDIMIIHYSDQHTTSSGYDAITVTRKTEQYANILREYLLENSLPAGDTQHIKNIINMFNAINGDWLLKLISSADNFRKEKISIQSAIKLALAFFNNSNIIWIPISLEEILRVSGAVGLSQKGGLFSASNLGYKSGATSDDLLMFGVEMRNGQVYVHLYPLEVKIGYKNADELTKATEQIKHTKQIFDQQLASDENENTLQSKFYRNFIAQLAVVSAEKLNLYEVWQSQDFEKITNTEVRGKLLNDDFIISNALHDEIGDGIIISFKDGAFMREVYKTDVTVLKFLQDDGIKYLTKSVDEIIEALNNMQDIAGKLFNPECLNYKVESIEKNNDKVMVKGNNETKTGETKSIADETDKNSGNESGISNEPTAEIIPHVATKSSEGMKILFGHDANTGSPLYWYPNNTEKVMHPNTGIIGTMGTGKTQFTKSLILQLIREQDNNPGNEPLGILIFDYKGDYNSNKQDFVDATNAKVYDLYHLPFNPFSVTVTPTSKPMLPMHIASTFRETLSTAYNLGKKQESALRDSIMQAYAMKGIDKADRNTWNKTAPVLRDVFNAFQASDAFKEDSLYSALSELDEFEIFETDPDKTVPLYDLINGVTVINLQGYDPSIQNLVVAITLDLFYSQMQVNGHSMIDGNLRQLRKFILVDEADNFLKLGFSSIRKILKEGREFGVGTILSTQFLKHFDTQQDDFSKYILSWIVHKVDDLSAKDVRNLFNTDSKSKEEELFSSIKKLTKHHSFVKLGDSADPYYIKDRAFWEILESKE